MLFQIQQTLHDRVRFAPIFDFLWPSGIGPRVEEPALLLINPGLVTDALGLAALGTGLVMQKLRAPDPPVAPLGSPA